MAKELDFQLSLGMNEGQNTSSLPFASNYGRGLMVQISNKPKVKSSDLDHVWIYGIPGLIRSPESSNMGLIRI